MIASFFHHPFTFTQIRSANELFSRGGGWPGLANASGNALAEVRVYLAPEFDSTFLHRPVNTLAEMAGDVVHQVIAVSLREHMAVEVARLHKIVILGVRL